MLWVLHGMAQWGSKRWAGRAGNLIHLGCYCLKKIPPKQSWVHLGLLDITAGGETTSHMGSEKCVESQ